MKQTAAGGSFTNVYVGFADKTAKFSDATGIPPDYDPTGRPWYKQAVAAGKPVVTPPYVDVGTGKLVVAFAAPVVRDGAVKAVISGDVAMDSVIANVKSIHPTPSSFGMLIDASGHIVAHPDAKLTLKPVSDLAARSDQRQALRPFQHGSSAGNGRERQHETAARAGDSRHRLVCSRRAR